MNYLGIKKVAAALFMVATSSLSATTASCGDELSDVELGDVEFTSYDLNAQLKTTQDKVNKIFENFSTIHGDYTSMGYRLNDDEIKALTAQINNLKEKIKDLIDLDKNIVNQRSPKFGNTTITIHAACLGYTDIIDTLSKRKRFNINIQDNLGNTPLITAALKNQHGAIELLLKHRADITIKNNNKKTALDIAIEKLEKLEKCLENAPSVDEGFDKAVENPNIKATKETIRLLKAARNNLYIKRVFWLLAAVLLVTLTGWGIIITSQNQNRYSSGLTQQTTLKFVTFHASQKT